MDPEGQSAAAALYAQLCEGYDQLDQAGRREFRRLLTADRVLMQDVAWRMLLQTVHADGVRQRERRNRARKENKERNDAIRADAARGLTHEQIAKKLTKTTGAEVTAEAVRAVLKRDRKKRPAG